MPVDGPNICGTGAQDASAGGVPWTGFANITADDTSYANCAAAIATTYYLTATNFGHAVPTGATITEIRFHVFAKATAPANQDHYLYAYVIKGGTIETDYNASAEVGALQSAFTDDQFMGDDGLWHLTWTPADVNASNFGFAVALNLGSSTNAEIDYIASEITYTAGGGGGGSSQAALVNFLCRHDRQHQEQGSSLWQPSPQRIRSLRPSLWLPAGLCPAAILNS